jgi:hypothetical protein
MNKTVNKTHLSKHTGWDRKIKKSILFVIFTKTGFLTFNLLLEFLKGFFISIGFSSLIMAQIQKGLNRFLGMVGLFQKGTQAIAQLLVGELGPSVPVDDNIFGQELVGVKVQQGREGLLLGEIAAGSHHDHRQTTGLNPIKVLGLGVFFRLEAYVKARVVLVRVISHTRLRHVHAHVGSGSSSMQQQGFLSWSLVGFHARLVLPRRRDYNCVAV